MKFQVPANFRDMFLIGNQKRTNILSPYDYAKFAVFNKEVGRVRVALQLLLYSAVDGERTVI